MEIITIALFGIVEGLTEFIPVSSTAHLLLLGNALQVPSGAFLEALSICIQSGAILAGAWYFLPTIWKNKSLIPKVIVAFIPTGIVGITLYPIIKTFFTNTLLIPLALITGGIIFLFLKPIESPEEVSTVTYSQAFLIGIAQIFSFIPGVSRAGATLIGGSLLKIPRSLIVPFSFLLGIPTILGASVVEARAVEHLSQTQWLYISIATVVAFIVARLTIHFFITILTKKPLSWWGWYRIAIGIIALLFLV